MNAKIFSYKADGIVLETVNEQLKLSPNFDRKALLDQLKALLKKDNFKPDESSLSYKIKDEQLYIEGLAVENEEPKSMGFFSNKI